MRPSIMTFAAVQCNLKHKIWRPCWRILKQNKHKARISVDRMRNNLDGDVTKSYKMNQGPSLLKNFGGTNLYRLRFDDVNMLIQPWYDLFVKLAKWGTHLYNLYNLVTMVQVPSLVTPMVVVGDIPRYLALTTAFTVKTHAFWEFGLNGYYYAKKMWWLIKIWSVPK